MLRWLGSLLLLWGVVLAFTLIDAEYHHQQGHNVDIWGIPYKPNDRQVGSIEESSQQVNSNGNETPVADTSSQVKNFQVEYNEFVEAQEKIGRENGLTERQGQGTYHGLDLNRYEIVQEDEHNPNTVIVTDVVSGCQYYFNPDYGLSLRYSDDERTIPYCIYN